MERPGGFFVEPVRFEQKTDVPAGLAFGRGVAKPRRFLNHHRLQILIFLQGTIERGSVFPEIEDAADLRVGIGDVTAKSVGVKPVEDLFAALVGVLHQVRQGHHGVPRGLRNHLHGQ